MPNDDTITSPVGAGSNEAMIPPEATLTMRRLATGR